MDLPLYPDQWTNEECNHYNGIIKEETYLESFEIYNGAFCKKILNG